MKPATWIYFAQAEGGFGPIKIGFSKDPTKRVKALSSQHGARLVILAKIPGDYWREQRLHEALAEWRLEGEWYDPTCPHFAQIIPQPDPRADRFIQEILEEYGLPENEAQAMVYARAAYGAGYLNALADSDNERIRALLRWKKADAA